WAGPGSLFPVIRGREDGSARSTVTGRGDSWLDAVLPESRAADRARPTGPARSRACPGFGRTALTCSAATAPTSSACSIPPSQPEQDRRGGGAPPPRRPPPPPPGPRARAAPPPPAPPPPAPPAQAGRAP